MGTILVLEGGAMRGIYTAGVLDAMMDNNIKVDAIIGVSAAALFGINFASKQRGRCIRYNLKYAGKKNYMGLYSLLTTGNIMNKKFCFDTLVNELDPFDFETLKKSKIKFYATVTNLNTGGTEYIQINNLKDNMEYLRASGSMPLVSRIVKINNNKYLDGAIGNSIPINEAINMGYNKIITVLTRQEGYQKEKSKMLPYKIVYRKYPNFIKSIENRYIKYNNTLKQIKELKNKDEIFVIQPSEKVVISKIEKNKNTIQYMYDLGYKDTINNIEQLKKYLKK